MINLRIRIMFLGIIGALAWLGFSATSTAGGDGMKLLWSTKTDGPINLPPVTSGNVLMVVPKGQPLMAFNANNGSPLWQYAPKAEVWSRSLGSDAKHAYACTKGGKIAALDINNGKKIWETDLGIDCQRPPHISTDAIYVATTLVGQGIETKAYTGAKLFSINPETGAINWSFETDTYLLQTPHGFGDTVYVGGSYRDPDFDEEEGGPIRFYSLNSKSGKPNWIYESHDGLPKALYATRERMVYVGYQDYIVGIDAADGKKVWRKDAGNWVPSLNGLADVVFYGAANTKVHAWNTKDGKEHWRFNIPGGSFNYMLGRPLFDGDRMYFMSQKGTVFVLNHKSGKEIWSQPTGMDARAGLSVGEKMLFMGDSKGNVYAYSILK